MSSAAICRWETIDAQTQGEAWKRHSSEPASENDLCLQAELELAEVKLKNIGDAEEEEVPVYSKDAFRRASIFLKAQSAQFCKMYNVPAPIPNIGPGPNGSIDLHWKRKDYELLVNIPVDNCELASFYGDNYGTHKIKGSFDPTTFDYGIIMWLMKN
jgi:hypothetical protein